MIFCFILSSSFTVEIQGKWWYAQSSNHCNFWLFPRLRFNDKKHNSLYFFSGIIKHLYDSKNLTNFLFLSKGSFDSHILQPLQLLPPSAFAWLDPLVGWNPIRVIIVIEKGMFFWAFLYILNFTFSFGWITSYIKTSS